MYPSIRAMMLGAVLAGHLSAARADEGFWPYNHLPTAHMEAALGFAPDAAWLDRLQAASVRLGAGCSGSFVSAHGLVLTNQHCALTCLRDLSHPQEDLSRTGHVADTLAGERRCPTTEIFQLQDITDVSGHMAAATAGLQDAPFAEALAAATATLVRQCAAAPGLHCEVISLYQGTRYELYRYRRFDDVRLVFAPEWDIAMFGADPDNYNFPRYVLDMVVLRVYENGRPLITPDHLRLSRTSAGPGDAVLLSGHPSATHRQLTLAQFAFKRDVELPRAIAHWSEYRGVLMEFARRDAAAAQAARVDLMRVENRLKVLKGRLDILLSADFWQHKQQVETALRAQLAAESWDIIAAAGDIWRLIHDRYVFLEEGWGFHTQLFTLARDVWRMTAEAQKPDAERLDEYQTARLARVSQRLHAAVEHSLDLEMATLSWSLTRLRDVLSPDDPLVRAVLGAQTPQDKARQLVTGTRLGDAAFRTALLAGGPTAVEQSNDPMLALARQVDAAARAVRLRHDREVAGPARLHAARIAQGQFALAGFAGYPDATGSLRLSFGRVAGWTAPDGGDIPTHTTLAGLFARATGAPPFRLPQSWLAARDRLDMNAPLNLVNTADTVGGNSGSPVVNEAGELIGLHFDGNIYAAASDYWYDGRRRRAIAVDVAAMRAALTHVYPATHLLREMDAGEPPP